MRSIQRKIKRLFARPEGLVDTRQAAELLGITPHRARTLVSRGPIPGRYRFGELLIAKRDLAKFVAAEWPR